ncbi:MAG: hypothetical protein JJT95_09650 [Pararhodobacter sp.]|nr:hypothetical protein [Pararhodobacter sp.]
MWFMDRLPGCELVAARKKRGVSVELGFSPDWILDTLFIDATHRQEVRTVMMPIASVLLPPILDKFTTNTAGEMAEYWLVVDRMY